MFITYGAHDCARYHRYRSAQNDPKLYFILVHNSSKLQLYFLEKISKPVKHPSRDSREGYFDWLVTDKLLIVNHSKSIETLKIELTTITTERNELKIKYTELNNNYTILIEKVGIKQDSLCSKL